MYIKSPHRMLSKSPFPKLRCLKAQGSTTMPRYHWKQTRSRDLIPLPCLSTDHKNRDLQLADIQSTFSKPDHMFDIFASSNVFDWDSFSDSPLNLRQSFDRVGPLDRQGNTINSSERTTGEKFLGTYGPGWVNSDDWDPNPSWPGKSTNTVPRLQVDDATMQVLSTLMTSTGESKDNRTLPGKRAIQRYLMAYFNIFHDQLPLIHLPTFVPEDCPGE